MAIKWNEKEVKYIVKNLELKPKDLYEKFTKKFGEERSYKSVASKQEALKRALNESTVKVDEQFEEAASCGSDCDFSGKINNVKEKAEALFVEAKTKIEPLVKQTEEMIQEVKEKVKNTDIDLNNVSTKLTSLFSKIEEKAIEFETKLETLVGKAEVSIKDTIEKVKVSCSKEEVTKDEVTKDEIVVESPKVDASKDGKKLKHYKEKILELKENGNKTKDILDYLLYNTNLDSSTTKEDLKKFIKKNTK